MNRTGLVAALRSGALALAAGIVLSGCGAGSAPVTQNPGGPTVTLAGYNGPAPASADVQAFVINFWNNVKGQDKCGACHIQANQSPTFARSDDVNLAYAAAQTIVDLSAPGQSRVVAKVAGGHHCWLASTAACGDTLTTWIKNWAGIALGNTSGTIVLKAPVIQNAGSSRSFPDSSAQFAATVYPLLTKYCSRCHSPAAVTPQSPYFAQANVDAAYAAAQPKINLDQPELSRFYVRLHQEFHNCWGGDCNASSAAMLAAIQAFANGIPITPIDPSLVLSKALGLYDGTVASGGNRVETGLVAKFEFKTGTGSIAYDTSGVEPALNLNLFGDVTWVGGWGVQIQNKGKLQGTTNGSAKLTTLIQQTGEYSVEAWAAPANVTQEMSYIASYSGGETTRNFTLGQTMYNYDFMQRSTTTDANGSPMLSTPSAQQVLQATLQHVVLTYDPVNGRQIYVNGQLINVTDPQKGGNLSQWDNTFALVLGNEVSGTRPWSGVLRLVALYNHALKPNEIKANFDAGVGERYYLLFKLDDTLTNMAQSYLMFLVSQYDSYAYLFTKPSLISLDPTVKPSGVRIKGVRIGENGTELKAGQAYATLDLNVDATGYSSSTGVLLSPVGTVVALNKGPAYDQFFLTFEQLGSATHVHTEPVPLAPIPVDVPRPSDLGIRLFEHVNATLSAMTRVPRTQPAVSALYGNLTQALPTTDSLQGFVASHQTAIAQLAIQYCDALVSDPALLPARTAMFPTLNFNASPTVALPPGGRDSLFTPLIDAGLSANSAAGKFLATQPDPVAVRAELDALTTKLSASVTQDATGTATVVKAACAAVTGSAAMLVQ